MSVRWSTGIEKFVSAEERERATEYSSSSLDSTSSAPLSSSSSSPAWLAKTARARSKTPAIVFLQEARYHSQTSGSSTKPLAFSKI